MATAPSTHDAEVRRNCWTCLHDGLCGCRLMGSMRSESLEWMHRQGLNEVGMPPRASTGCPGWEPA